MDKDNKKKGSEEYSNISFQIKEIDKNIKHYNTSILLLKEDLVKQEKAQVLRGKNREKIREKIINLEFSASRPGLHSASSEKNFFAREKSYFE